MKSKRTGRFPVPALTALSREQDRFVRALLEGPRGGGDTSREARRRILDGGPFNAWLRSPELGQRLQRVGEYIRFHSSLPRRLNEFAILITARHWTAQYEWYAHLPLAVQAGLDPGIAADLALGQRPRGMKADEAAVHRFCTELHRTTRVGKTAFQRVVDLFGERGAVDLIGLCGYYTAVAMTLNVAEAPVPAGERNPLRRRSNASTSRPSLPRS